MAEGAFSIRQIVLRVIMAGVLFFRYYLDLLIDRCFGVYYNYTLRNKDCVLPSSQESIIMQSATTIARNIRLQRYTVTEVVLAFINRCEQVHQHINAIVDNRFHAALKQAQDLDKAIESGEITDEDFNVQPFLGVPFTTKESTAAEGLSHTFGLVKRKGMKADQDAEVIELMKGAGGILLGVTNIPQLNLWQETSNPIFGTTNNPYDIRRNVGGSSGGEASLVAAGGSPIGIGTDIGGSIRIPAFMCGVFGHKPTCDLISTRGLTFRKGTEGDTMVVAGPLVKYAEDIIPVLQILLGSQYPRLNLEESVDIRKLQIYYVKDPKDPFVSPFRHEMLTVFKKVITYFTNIQPLEPQELSTWSNFKYGGKFWRYWMTQEPNANFKRDLTNRESEVNVYKELIKYTLKQSDFNAAVILNLINNEILPAENADWIRAKTEQLRSDLIDKLGDNGVLIYPSAPWPASFHRTALLRPWNFNLFSIWNTLKLPVTQVPLGLSKNGLPLGIQVVSSPYNDRLCIAVAKELEMAFGGYVPPYRYD